VRIVPEEGDDPLLETDVLLQQGGLLEAGPLDPGNVRVALLPAEFDRETWALGTEMPSESARVQIEEAGATDLGTIQIHCGPRAVLRLTAGARPVDLGRGSAQVRGSLVEDRRLPLRTLSLQRSPDSLEVTGLPEGMVELTVTLCSPEAPPAGRGRKPALPRKDGRSVRSNGRFRPRRSRKVQRDRVEWPWP
jgi:hypothetical protein